MKLSLYIKAGSEAMFTLYWIGFTPFQKLLRYSVNKNRCSVAMHELFRSIPSVNRSHIRHTICNTPSDLKGSFTNTRLISVAISAPIKLFRLDSDRFKNLSDIERYTFNSGAEQYCSGAETASKAAFLV